MTQLTAVAPQQAQSVLCHSASRLVSLEDLAAIPAGPAVGPRHRPVAHIHLVDAVRQAFTHRGYAVSRETFSVTHDDARLFGTLDLVPTTGTALTDGMDGGMAVGLRHANDQAFALGVIAGLRIFVCDNLSFYGGRSLMHRKHTTRLELASEIERGMDRTFHSYRDLVELAERLRATTLSDSDARLLLYSLVLDGNVIAPNQLSKIHAWYFTPELIADDSDRERGLSDVEPRTAWALANAVTRVCRGFAPHRQQDIGMALSNHLAAYVGMPPIEPDLPDAN